MNVWLYRIALLLAVVYGVWAVGFAVLGWCEGEWGYVVFGAFGVIHAAAGFVEMRWRWREMQAEEDRRERLLAEVTRDLEELGRRMRE